MDRNELYRFIKQNCSLEDMHVLCTDLGFDFEDLNGVNVESKAFALVAFMERRGRSSELIEYCQKEEPALLEKGSSPQSPPSSQPQTKQPQIKQLNVNTLTRLLLTFFNKDEQAHLANKLGSEYVDFQTTFQKPIHPLIETLATKGQLETFVVDAKQIHPELSWEQAYVAPGILAAEPPTFPDVKAISNLIIEAMLEPTAFAVFLKQHSPDFLRKKSQNSSIEGQARELIQFMQRRGRLDELLTPLRSAYPAEYEQFGPYIRAEKSFEKQKREAQEKSALSSEAVRVIDAEVTRREKDVPAGLVHRHTLYPNGARELRSLAWMAQGEQLLSLTYDDALQTWDAQQGKELTYHRGNSQENILVAAPLPNGKEVLLIVGPMNSKRLNIQRLADNKVQAEIKNVPNHNQSGAVSPDGKWAVIRGEGNSLQAWDLMKAQRLEALPGHLKEVSCVIITPDGKRIISGAQDETIRIWDTEGELLHTLTGHTAEITHLAVSPDGRQLASSQKRSSQILVWQLPKLKRGFFSRPRDDESELVRTLIDHTSWITSLSFSADGRFLASKSLDYTVRLWQCDGWKTAVTMMETQKGAVAFHPHKPLLATGGEKGKAIRIWELVK